ncbi:CD209 antigen-like protein D [Anabas testudineus]|uniref:CD209 antigen-like protein D n=1 Tax=Anabas testudineus TaxID=64144 RepID=UPI000E460D99|nr:CD209 antigen-like protein D [Anabas testudineus]
MRIKSIRRIREDRRERESVEMLEDREESNGEKKLGVVTVSLVLLYLLILAAIAVRYVSFTLEKEQLTMMNKELRSKNNKLRNLYNQSQNDVKLLQSRLAETAVNYSKIHDEVKKLKVKHEEDQGNFCPEGWTRFRCSCYFKSTENKTWSESRTDCENRESDLVMINSKEEQDFVSQMSMNRESWIGLTVTTHGSNIRYSWSWAWVDGSPLTETFWAAGQREAPLNSFSRVALGQSGKWKTQVYYSGNFWICEKKVTCSC